MAKAVADVDSPSNQGGFTTENGSVTGFSTMHDSGTGTKLLILILAFHADETKEGAHPWATLPYFRMPHAQATISTSASSRRKLGSRNIDRSLSNLLRDTLL